ncbi:MAG TPA: ARMT1-like domain-containing protein [Candidatus Lokiarchaeia archaeon]|nr:ARMT1-like domain-containing protein [Candidatus Lokiarchaeia archaeon]
MRYAIPYCAPCLLESAFNALCKAMGSEAALPDKDSGDFATQMEIIREFLRIMQDFSEDSFPVILASEMLQVIKRTTSNLNPYHAEKALANQICLNFTGELQEKLDAIPGKKDQLRQALFWAIAGNNIDFITPGHAIDLTSDAIRRVLEETEGIGLVRDDFEALWELIARGNRPVVYLLDNAGEIVFDKLVLCVLQSLGTVVTAVVKGGPVSNDATLEGAETVNLSENGAQVETTGTDDLGFNWNAASDSFRALFEGNPVVISKGQANFEAFHAYGSRMPPLHFFGVLKVKCAANAAAVGGNKGDQVILQVPVE